MYKWLKSKILYEEHEPAWIAPSAGHGLTQGGVLSPNSLSFINDLVAELPRGVKASLYAVDLVIR